MWELRRCVPDLSGGKRKSLATDGGQSNWRHNQPIGSGRMQYPSTSDIRSRGEQPQIPWCVTMEDSVCQHGMCVCVFSLLCERRILITSRRLGRLTACVHAAAALIYPLHWRVSSLCSAFRLLLRHGGGIVKIRLDVIQK